MGSRHRRDHLRDQFRGDEVPERPDVELNRILINNLSGPGGMNSIVNGCGPTIDGFPEDTACLERSFVMPFFLDFGGPAP